MYIHIKPDHIMPGLPAGDLDETTLSEERLKLLLMAAAVGVYRKQDDALPINDVIEVSEEEDESGTETGDSGYLRG